MQDADSQLVKLILTLEMLISVKHFLFNLKMFFQNIFLGPGVHTLCAHSHGDGGSDPVRTTTRLTK